MRLTLRKVVSVVVVLLFVFTASSQSNIPTNINHTVVELPCGQTCTDMNFQIPHIKMTTDYIYVPIKFDPYAWVTPGGNEDPGMYQDDNYSIVFVTPFNFCFYGTQYNKVVISSNGLITMDELTSTCNTGEAAWNITHPIPYIPSTDNGTCGNGINGDNYPRASIMGAFMDLDSRLSACPADRKIEWRAEGVAPYRRFVASFYHIGSYDRTSCGQNASTAATFQIVIYESTGLIDIHIANKICSSDLTNGSKAIAGVMDFTRTKAVAATGKNGTSWTAKNESIRFVPSGGASAYINSQLLAMDGTFLANADTATTTPGLLDLKFGNFCPPLGATSFQIVTTFKSCDVPGEILTNIDTVTVNRSLNLNATATTTASGCGSPSGTVTVTVPPGIGTAPFACQVDGAGPLTTGASPITINNVSGGNHTITVTDASGVPCSSTITVNVGVNNNLIMTGASTPTTCAGINNGQITVTTINGAGPYQYVIDGGPVVTGPSPYTFTGLAAGLHSIYVTDIGGCTTSTFANVPVGSGPTATVTPTATSCPTSNNGSISIVPLTGVAPFSYQLNSGAFQPSGIFTGLAAGSYTVTIKDGSSCQTTIAVTVAAGAGVMATTTATGTSCSGASDGSITVTPTTGNAPFSFAIDGNTPVSAPAPYTFTGLGAGAHTIVVTDGSGCPSAPISVTVATGAGLTATTTSTATSCNGASNGSITVTPTTGNAPFSFAIDGNTPVSAPAPYTFTNLSSGAHTIIVSTAIGCSSAPITVSVAAGASLAATTTSTATSCGGATDGSITVTPASGTGPYTFTIDGGAPVSAPAPYTFTGLTSGSHTIVVTDVSVGCSSLPITVTVSSGAALTATTTTTTTSCSGALDGTITVSPDNGIAPYTFAIDGGAAVGGTAPYTFTGLPAGPHSIVITSSGGCVSTPIPVTVAAGPVLMATTSVTATSCSGATDGSIVVTPSNGVGPFSFAIDGGSAITAPAPYTFSNISAGSHTIVVSNASGCASAPITVTVPAGPVLAATTSVTATSCSGASDGSIVVTPTNGVGPFSFAIDGAAAITAPAPYTFSNLPSGAHTIVVSNASGCASAPIAVTVPAGPVLAATTSVVGTSCSGANNGSITVTTTNGVGPFSFAIDGGAPVTAPSPYTFTLLSSGSHTIVVSNASGCASAPITVNVPSGAGLTATTTTTATSCNGAINGTITVTPTNGNAPYTFAIDGGSPVAAAAPYTFTGLASGSHTLVITDGSGCISAPFTAVIADGAVLTTTATHTDASCNGVADGSITVTPPAGPGPYEYSLDGTIWQNTTAFNSLPAGNYTIYLREPATGCVGQITQIIAQPTVLTASVATQPVVCNGESNGTITVTASGGTTGYEYSLDGVTWQSSSVFTVNAGSYTVTIRDAHLCTTTQTAVVTEPAALTATAATTADAACNTDGQITVNATGGNAPLSYSLNGTTWQSGNVLTATPGTYTVYIKDSKGCTFNVPNITVGLVDDLTFTPPTNPTICEGSSVQLDIVSNAINYLWSPAGGLSSTTVSNPTASPTVTTTYTAHIERGNCFRDVPVTVTVNTAPIPDAGPPGDICFGQSYQLQGSGGVQYKWTPSTFLDDPAIFNPVATPDRTMTYSLSVRDANDCPSLVPSQVIVNVTPPIKVNVSPFDTVVYSGQQFQLLASSAGTNYVWSPTTGLSNPTIPNPVVTAGIIGDDVTYTVTATTSAGCKGVGFARVRVYKGPEIYVATAFTPNGDGKNDTFFPFPVGIKELKYFRVYNRWGQLVFSTTTMRQGWDGKTGGVEQASGVYVWMVEGVTLDNTTIKKRGTVTLIR